MNSGFALGTNPGGFLVPRGRIQTSELNQTCYIIIFSLKLHSSSKSQKSEAGNRKTSSCDADCKLVVDITGCNALSALANNKYIWKFNEEEKRLLLLLFRIEDDDIKDKAMTALCSNPYYIYHRMSCGQLESIIGKKKGIRTRTRNEPKRRDKIK